MSPLRRLILENFYRVAASGWIPRRLVGAFPPPTPEMPRASEPLKLEIVSHCWNYAHLLTYQLSSLVLYPPTRVSIRMTVFHSPEDRQTCEVLEHFAQVNVPGVTWNWRPLEKPRLFRRAIGRNLAALATEADWIWFTDCDQVFHRGCLDALAVALTDHKANLVFPRVVGCTTMLHSDDPIFRAVAGPPAIVDIDLSRFEPVHHSKAVGALQIVRGDVARAIGYCDGIRLYREPLAHWQKTYEDRTFRWLIGSDGEPVDIGGLYRISHVHKGRYRGIRKLVPLLPLRKAG
jgi:hypothetical protein